MFFTQEEIKKKTVIAWEERKKGVMEKLFCQKIRFKTDEKSEFPEWREKQFGEIISEFKEKTEIEKQKLDDLLLLVAKAIGIKLFLNREIPEVLVLPWETLESEFNC